MWCDFENLIERITREWFDDYFYIIVNNEDEQKIDEEVEKINRAYLEISSTLMEYLLEEEKRVYNKLNSVSKEIKKNSHALNFNYTNLLEKYLTQENIHYVHGSLAENFIVLGYKNAPRHEGMPFKARVFEKEILREVLNYRRFLEKKGLKSEEIEVRMNEYTPYLEDMFSGVGSMRFNYPNELDNKMMSFKSEDIGSFIHGYFGEPHNHKLSSDLEKRLKIERLKEISFDLNEYGEKNDFKPHPIHLNVNFSKVNELLIIGHSLEADHELIEEIFNKTINVKVIKMFVYEGESEEGILKKTNFINKFWNGKVEIIQY